jgi:WXXGXW repeat (2 copies)
MYAKFVHRALLITLLAVAYPAASFAGFFGVGVTVGFAPPPLPVYVQPPCPASGYIWTPGYWAYSGDDQDYYWVPGTWVLAPSFGWLWTPGYWGLIDAEYVWHEGYWGPHVGFYGGINYGFGYFGSGFVGGYWRDHDFYYNRAVTNVSNVRVTNVYNRTVINNNSYGSRPSFNGRNGVEARPMHGDLLAAREPHRAPTAPQRSQALSAHTLPSSLASVNHGHPQIAATPRPGIFHGQAVTPSRYASGTSAPARSSLIDRSHGLSSSRDTSHYSPPMNARPQASASHEQHAPNAPAPQHVGYAPNRVRAPAANRVSPSPSNAPRNAPSVPRNAPSASHSYSQPPHVSRQAPPQGQRRG